MTSLVAMILLVAMTSLVAMISVVAVTSLGSMISLGSMTSLGSMISFGSKIWLGAITSLGLLISSLSKISLESNTSLGAMRGIVQGSRSVLRWERCQKPFEHHVTFFNYWFDPYKTCFIILPESEMFDCKFFAKEDMTTNISNKSVILFWFPENSDYCTWQKITFKINDEI